MSKNGIQTPNFAHKIETCINPFRKWCTTYFIILMMQSWDQLWKTNTKTRQKWTELKEKSTFTIKKGSAELMLLFYQVPNHVVKFINEKRGAIFDIYLQRKKTESKILRQILCFELSEEVYAGTTQFLLVMLYFGLSLLRRCSKMWQSNVQ